MDILYTILITLAAVAVVAFVFRRLRYRGLGRFN